MKATTSHLRQQMMTRRWLCLVGVVSLLLGCASESSTEPDGNTDQVAKKQPGRKPGRRAGDAKPIVRIVGGKKWIGDVPYDVYFEDPLRVAADRRPVGGDAPTTAQTTKGTPPAIQKTTAKDAGTKTAAANGNAPDWKTLIPMETLKSEVKAIRNQMTARLQNVGKFNSSFQEIPADSSTLALLAGVASQHGEEVSWKANAKYVRDLSALMVAEKLARGKKSYESTKVPFEKITEILDGSTPAELPESAEAAVFSDYADFGNLMKRIDRTFRWMKTNASNEESYKEAAEKVLHELALISIISKAIQEEGYGFSDDEDFIKYAETMFSSARTMVTAVQTEKFADYDAAFSTIDQMCTQCHMGRR